MQGAKNSKTMLPRKRRAHLHKSASFKTSFEQIQKDDKKYAKNDSKMVEEIFKTHQKKSETTSKNITQNTTNC